MGATLKIAHNSFEKVKVERDRKERLQRVDDWQKEKARKLKALEEFKAKQRECRLLTEKNITDNSITSIGEDEDKVQTKEFVKGARRKISKSNMEKHSVSSNSSFTDDAMQNNLKYKKNIVPYSEKSAIQLASVIDDKQNSDEIPTDHQTTTRKRIEQNRNGWKFFRDNLYFIKNQKYPQPSNANTECKVLTSSPQEDCDILDASNPHMTENQILTATGKNELEYNRKETGCGGRHCIIC